MLSKDKPAKIALRTHPERGGQRSVEMGVGAGRLQAGSPRHTRPRVTGPGLGSLSTPVFFSR